MSVVGMDGKPVRQSVESPPVVVPLVDDIATASAICYSRPAMISLACSIAADWNSVLYWASQEAAACGLSACPPKSRIQPKA